MKKSSVFEKELEKVGHLENRSATVAFLETVEPEYFWYVPASSTGKYHPDFAQGEGGLIRHTKAAVCVAQEPVSYTHLRAHETRHDLVCRLLLEKKKTISYTHLRAHETDSYLVCRRLLEKKKKPKQRAHTIH